MGRYHTAQFGLLALLLLGAACGPGPAEPPAAQPLPAARLAARRAAFEERLMLAARIAPSGAPAAPPPSGAALLKALDVPFNTDETRQLAPVELPPVGEERSCGPACTQVTFLPGDFVADGWENRYNVSDDLLVTNVPIEGATVAVAVDLATGVARAFGVITPDLRLRHLNPACVAAVVSGGRVAYSCFADGGDGTYRSELRLFTPATGLERRLWKLPPGASIYTMPNGLGFLEERVSMINGPDCRGCDVLAETPAEGGAPTQLFPPAGAPRGGLTHGRASWPYVVFTDAQRYPPYVQVAYLDVSGDAAAPRLVAPTAVGDRWNPRLKGTRAAWMDTRNDPTHGLLEPRNVDIYARDLASGEEWAVCTHAARHEDPDVEGDLVVWADYRHNADPAPAAPDTATRSDIYLANLKTGHEVQLTDLPGLARDPRIDHGRVFFAWKPDDKPAQFYAVDLKQRGLAP
jgi:hypothetical protein